MTNKTKKTRNKNKNKRRKHKANKKVTTTKTNTPINNPLRNSHKPNQPIPIKKVTLPPVKKTNYRQKSNNGTK